MLEGICMNGDKQICTLVTGELGTLTVGQVVIAITDKHTAKAWNTIQFVAHTPRNLQNDLFFINIARAYRSRVITAMTRIDRDHYITVLWRRCGDRLIRLVGRVKQIDYEPMPVWIDGRQRECFRLQRDIAVDDDTIITVSLRGAQASA